MANQIPLLEGTDAAGGYLVRPDYGETLVAGVRRESAISQVATVEQVASRQRKYAIYSGRPTAEFVAEGADKPITGAEFAELSIDIKKIATTVVYTEELMEDAIQDPNILVSADVQGGIADLIDAHALGNAGGSTTAITTQFNAKLASTTNTVDFDASKGDGVAAAISAGMEAVEGNGYTPSGVVLSSKFRAVLRDARGAGDNATIPVFTPGYNREPDSLYGLPIVYSSNLPAPGSAAGTKVGYVVDGSHLRMLIRKDITVRMSQQGVVGAHNLFQQNKTAFLWETRVGFGVYDLNNSVAALKVKATT